MHSDSNVVISARHLIKSYRLFAHPGERIKQFFSLGMRQYHKEFTAVRDVSFDIHRGETVGIIGSNGAGKSTLLQLICGILKPTSGSVKVKGRVSALLELGAGFNPEFTGRENVFFQGMLMGLSREQMQERFDEIVAFADIGEFIDQHVRTYSSGMFVRLAFAVMVHVDADIIIVDEALAVGDMTFQSKCMQHLHALRERGACIVLVSHSMEQVAHFCSRTLALHKGQLIIDEATQPALQKYLALLRKTPVDIKATTRTGGQPLEQHALFHDGNMRWGDETARIHSLRLQQGEFVDPTDFRCGHTIHLTFYVDFFCHISQPIYGIAIKTPAGGMVLSANTLNDPAVSPQDADTTRSVRFSFTPWLDAGDYLLSIGVSSQTEAGITPHDRCYDLVRLRIAPPLLATGEVDMQPHFDWIDA